MREIKPCLDVDMAAPTHANGKKDMLEVERSIANASPLNHAQNIEQNQHLLAQAASKTQTHV